MRNSIFVHQKPAPQRRACTVGVVWNDDSPALKPCATRRACAFGVVADNFFLPRTIPTPTRDYLRHEALNALALKKTRLKKYGIRGWFRSDQKVIVMAFLERYRSLFAGEVEAQDLFVEQFMPLKPKLNEDVKIGLKRPLGIEEIVQAIDGLSNGNTPGAAFYKFFQAEISETLHRALTEADDVKKMPLPFKKSHIILILKTEDPERLQRVENYRPISHTNVYNKVYVKVIRKKTSNSNYRFCWCTPNVRNKRKKHI